MSLAKLVAERDNAIRTAALGSLEIVYAYEGDGKMSSRVSGYAGVL